MVQTRTLFRVCDNSGAKKVRCIKILGGFKRRFAKIGDIIVVSVRQVKQHKKKKIKIQEGNVAYALIVRTKWKEKRQNFSFFRCEENAVVLLTNKKKPIATRVVGPVPKQLRHSKFMKIASLAAGFY